MSYGANSIHKQLRTELEDYIKSQYFGKSPLLLSAVSDHLDDEGLLYQKPYIESSPAYQSVPDGIQKSGIPAWMKSFFAQLSEKSLGVFPSPFVHQIEALEAAVSGRDVFVSTGTGSGKTECFLWPLLAKLAAEAHDSPQTWNMRGVRAIILYPMNALVSDQVSRLRKLIGDREGYFTQIFRAVCGSDSRRPQFGMYTGRTPYPGEEPDTRQDRMLERTLRRMTFPATEMEAERAYFEKLLAEGKIPAKANMEQFLQSLHEGKHIPDLEDAELVTRFEMQQFCPDILITNYSMLEYMLLRPIERKIWNSTREWLNSKSSNSLLFVIDEAHMYKGSSGGEVALLIQRLFYKLGVSRNKVQFILTTASMPDKDDVDREAVRKFAQELTAADVNTTFCYLTGKKEEMSGGQDFDIPLSHFLTFTSEEFEREEQTRLDALNRFWMGIAGSEAPFLSLDAACLWMYSHLTAYRPFFQLMKQCRGTAVSLEELATSIFLNAGNEDALYAVSILLAIAPLARSEKGAVLFPARMHMLFRGIRGVYACANGACPHSHTDGALTLGQIFLSDGNMTCPDCGSVVYELYNDRRCGALFFHGYILQKNGCLPEKAYLWRYPGRLMDTEIKEILLFISPEGYAPVRKGGKNPIRPCYLDVKSGFLYFRDNSLAGKPDMRKLYYSDFSVKGRPQTLTFFECPHCLHRLSQTQLTSFSTRGNQSFFNLVQSQFQAQPPVPGKDQDPAHLPNEGRKVLLFSDSRQRAARLARDMSNASDDMAARQLFVLAAKQMEQAETEYSLDVLYDYFCLAAGQRNVWIFLGRDRTKEQIGEPERPKFLMDCDMAKRNYERSVRRGKSYTPRFKTANAPVEMQETLLRLFCGGYNTLYDSAVSWLEPTSDAMDTALDALEERGIHVDERDFLEIFNAWILSACDKATVLGHTISDTVRREVRSVFGGYGLDKDWKFSKEIQDILGWKASSQDQIIWCAAFREAFLDVSQPDNGRLYVDLSCIRPRFDLSHTWYCCERCSELTPFLLRGRCPSCAGENVHAVTQEEYDALRFWRTPIEDALDGKKIHVIDTEEHTAQISHKDQRDALWSRTEQYELRFQDMVQRNETPVDILSSTTTMEVGIDIGSLVAIGLRNIPPMRENYQQRAGRAGRRGASLSTIVTFCEDGPHDTLYFNDPVPMFRGDPRRPWIDIHSEKLLHRHLAMILFQEFLSKKGWSLDTIPAAAFLDDFMDEFQQYTAQYALKTSDTLLLSDKEIRLDSFQREIVSGLSQLKQKRTLHPDLFGVKDSGELEVSRVKSLLDALYEEGMIPTYSFPKDVVSTYITDVNGRLIYQPERGLDVAISEYAPGRSIVVDKQTYQIGGLYSPGSEWRSGQASKPARHYVEDGNYMKRLLTCKCGWFGLKDEAVEQCPFCGNPVQENPRPMLRPWGLAPRDAGPIPDAQLTEEYSFAQDPIYSTLPEAEKMCPVAYTENIRIASLSNQRIIMLNQGPSSRGFMICRDCGAAMPGNDAGAVLKDIGRPYRSKLPLGKCKHDPANVINVNLGYDFVTDMVVLEFYLDKSQIDAESSDSLWLSRAAQSLAEALRLAASKELDVEFTELVTGYRFRRNTEGSFIDLYLYDNLSSGAGYAVRVAEDIHTILDRTKKLLEQCDCESACHHCLKHYRNQRLHGVLDRHAALDLLEWGIHGKIAPPFSFSRQWQYFSPFLRILKMSGCTVQRNLNRILLRGHNREKTVFIYPAMWIEPKYSDAICVSDAWLKYARPYALQKLLDGIS